LLSAATTTLSAAAAAATITPAVDTVVTIDVTTCSA